MSSFRYVVVLLLLFAVGVLILRGGRYLREDQVQSISYNEFLDLVAQGEVEEVELRDGFRRIRGRTRQQVHFTTDGAGDPAIAAWIHEKSPATTIHNRTQPGMERWSGLISMVLVVALVLGVLYVLMLRQSGNSQQAFSFGQSRARRFSESMPRKTFEDVAGAEEAKQELVEIVDFLRHGEKYRRLGAEVPRGVLLLGPPGCGKTLMARAVAGEASVPFFHISGSDFVELFVGVGASRVRDLFTKAKASKPCIVFIDEIDAVGRQRGAGLGGGHDEREQTLNQLLVEMDGFEPNTGIIVIAATNRPDILDPALLRPGRFDRRVVVDAPDFQGRKEILHLYLRSKPMVPEVDVEVLARQTPGFTGADLANLVNESAILAARADKQTIDMGDLQEAIERVIAGPERRSRVITDEEKRLIAYHEVGHAVVSRLLRHGLQVHKITILPRGLALGYVLQLPLADRHLVTQSALEDEVTATLGGRAAEEVFFCERTTGARQDLEKVTEVARAMVCEYGMSEAAGPRTLGRRHGPVFLGRDIYEDRDYSEEMAQAIDGEIRGIVDRCYERAKRLLADNREVVEEVVHALLVQETISGEEMERLLTDGGVELPEQVPFPWSAGQAWPPAHGDSSVVGPREQETALE